MAKAGTNAGLGKWCTKLAIQPVIQARSLGRLDHADLVHAHCNPGLTHCAALLQRQVYLVLHLGYSPCRQSRRYTIDYLRELVQTLLLGYFKLERVLHLPQNGRFFTLNHLVRNLEH